MMYQFSWTYAIYSQVVAITVPQTQRQGPQHLGNHLFLLAGMRDLVVDSAHSLRGNNPTEIQNK